MQKPDHLMTFDPKSTESLKYYKMSYMHLFFS